MRDNKVMDIFIGICLSAFTLIIWVYQSVVTSDIHVETSHKDSVVIICMLGLFLIIYSFYIRKTKYILLNTHLLSIPAMLWFMNMMNAIHYYIYGTVVSLLGYSAIYHYDKFDTIVSIIGFSATFISLIQFIYCKKNVNT
ncbi:hypothetical protein [Clostridium sp.]|jgi:hypothetical protein|uniref:hypothetical protein n=1 Tax=Clostridium sp. TaxID=1506 RepID=UPI003EE9EF13